MPRPAAELRATLEKGELAPEDEEGAKARSEQFLQLAKLSTLQEVLLHDMAVERIAADNVAWLKRFAIGLLKQVKSKESIVMRRRMVGWNDDFLLQVLGIKDS